MLDKIKDILVTINNLMAQLTDKTEQLEKMKSENVALKKEVETLKAESAAKATAEAEAAKKELNTVKADLKAKNC